MIRVPPDRHSPMSLFERAQARATEEMAAKEFRGRVGGPVATASEAVRALEDESAREASAAAQAPGTLDGEMHEKKAVALNALAASISSAEEAAIAAEERGRANGRSSGTIRMQSKGEAVACCGG